MINTQPGTILFDGVCNMCNGLVQFIIKRDPQARFSFAALQSDAGRALLTQYGIPVTQTDTFVYICEKKCYIKSTAALKVLKDLGGAWKIIYILIIIPKPIRDFVYNLFAKSRYKLFGKRDSCMMPTANIRRRFLE